MKHTIFAAALIPLIASPLIASSAPLSDSAFSGLPAEVRAAISKELDGCTEGVKLEKGFLQRRDMTTDQYILASVFTLSLATTAHANYCVRGTYDAAKCQHWLVENVFVTNVADCTQRVALQQGLNDATYQFIDQQCAAPLRKYYAGQLSTEWMMKTQRDIFDYFRSLPFIPSQPIKIPVPQEE
jgi:hypothetical protein